MDHRQLQLFLAVAERLNLSQAAEAMNITQPGLSKSMHRLQQTLVRGSTIGADAALSLPRRAALSSGTPNWSRRSSPTRAPRLLELRMGNGATRASARAPPG